MLQDDRICTLCTILLPANFFMVSSKKPGARELQCHACRSEVKAKRTARLDTSLSDIPDHKVRLACKLRTLRFVDL